MNKSAMRLALLLAAGATIALGGCRENEQDRILLFDKGEYLGAPDEALPPDSAATLRQRASGQQF